MNQSNHTGTTKSLNVLVIDDEINMRRTMTYCLETDGHTAIAVGNRQDALTEMTSRAFDLAFVDLRLGKHNGMDLIEDFQRESPWTKIVVITAYASVETAVEAMKKGAVDYIPKPFSPDQILLQAAKISQIRAMEREITELKEEKGRQDPEATFDSNSPAMQRIIETARKAADSEAIILLRGESGTGKSVIAKSIHHWSPRASKSIGVVSCPAVPAELLESELFGHAKGAFTGAVQDNPGRIAACSGGTLFLDEIGDLPLSLQAKLLRFIQDRSYERLGDPTTRKADVRIIAATNLDLEERIADGRFREDLYYRLNVISLTLPPLRERKEDILPLGETFLTFLSKNNHKQITGFTQRAAEALQNHDWPGNLRELRNAIERAVILGNKETVDIAELPENIGQRPTEPTIGDPVPLAKIEELHIRRVLAAASSIQEAADILDIDQATLWRRRKSYGI